MPTDKSPVYIMSLHHEKIGWLFTSDARSVLLFRIRWFDIHVSFWMRLSVSTWPSPSGSGARFATESLLRPLLDHFYRVDRGLGC